MPEQKQFDMLFKSVQFLLYSIQRGLETQCILSPMFIPLVATTTTTATAAVNAVSVLRSGPVRFFCYFWTNRNRNRLPNTEIQKKPDRNHKKPVRTSSNATS